MLNVECSILNLESEPSTSTFNIEHSTFSIYFHHASFSIKRMPHAPCPMPHAPCLLRQIPPCRDALFLADAELGEDLREPPSFGVARFPRAAEHVDFVRLDFGRDGEAVLRLLRVGRLYFAPRSIDEFASAEAIAFPRLI